MYYTYKLFERKFISSSYTEYISGLKPLGIIYQSTLDDADERKEVH